MIEENEQNSRSVGGLVQIVLSERPEIV